MVLLSVAIGDKDGRPDPKILDELFDYTLLCTDLHDWIRLSTGGQRLWVEVERRE